MENKIQEFVYSLQITVLILVLRFGLKKKCFAPIGIFLEIKDKPVVKVKLNPILEKSYETSKKWKHEEIKVLAKQVNMSERQIESWLKMRQKQDKPSTLTKFCEASWHFFFSSYSCIFGAIIVWYHELWKLDNCWKNFGQEISNDIWWYYLINLAFYLSLSVSHVFDVKLKKFKLFLIHHLVTIILIYGSWITHTVKLGCLVYFIFDFAHLLFSLRKILLYIRANPKKQKIIFVIFLIQWIILRIIYFPFFIITDFVTEGYSKINLWAWFILLVLSLIIAALNCLWAIMLFKMLLNLFKCGKLVDILVPSSSEDFEEVELNFRIRKG